MFDRTPGSSTRAESGPALVPVLRLGDVTMIVMGSIIGSGIFYAPSAVAQQTGSLWGILTVWCLGGVFAITGAFVFAELGAMFPRTGGQYVFVREGYGRLTAFLFGWILLTAIVSPAIAFVAGVFVDHGERIAQACSSGFEFSGRARSSFCMGLIALLALVNMRGIRQGAVLQNLAMSAKILGLLMVVLLGAGIGLGLLEPRADLPVSGTGDPAFAPGAGGLGALGVALLSVVFSYGGWQNVTAVASEIREPQRTLPAGIVIGTLGVIALYVALNAALVALLGVEGLAACSTPVATAAGRVLPFGEPLVAGLVMISSFAVCQLLLMLAPRVFYAMASDGVFFRSAAWVHPTFRTPVVSIATLACAAVAHVLLAEELQDQLEITTLADTAFMALCALALFGFRRTRPDAPRPWRTPGYPVLPAVFLLFSGGMVLNAIANARPDGVWLVGALFATGVVLYWFWSSSSSPPDR